MRTMYALLGVTETSCDATVLRSTVLHQNVHRHTHYRALPTLHTLAQLLAPHVLRPGIARLATSLMQLGSSAAEAVLDRRLAAGVAAMVQQLQEGRQGSRDDASDASGCSTRTHTGLSWIFDVLHG